jgi:hypothetical protein
MRVPAADDPPCLEAPVPHTLPPDSVTAVLLAGSAPAGARLRLRAGGEERAPLAQGMPRPDLPGGRTGWWGILPVRVASDIALEAVTDAGAVEIARIASAPIAQPVDRPANGSPIAVCMATYEPDPVLLRRQVDTLRAQTDTGWTCVISDDGSSPAALESIEHVLEDDPRFVLCPARQRRGFYRNFERALALAPRSARWIALCDQDDIWHPEKLATLRAAIGQAPLAYSDLRLVDERGTTLRDTFWRGRRNNTANLTSMLVANSITGAAMLLRRELAESALPFPPEIGLQFHDHWLAVAALAHGPAAYVDRPLYDYVQHRRAVFGEVSGGERPATARAPRGVRWRAGYFYGYLPRVLQAMTLLARVGDELPPPRRQALERFVAAEGSAPALLRLAGRPARRLVGRTETLGGERELAQGLLWRRLARRGAVGDASFPDALAFEQRGLRRWRSRL